MSGTYGRKGSKPLKKMSRGNDNRGGLIQISRSQEGAWTIAEIPQGGRGPAPAFATQTEAVRKAAQLYPRAVVVLKGEDGKIRKVKGVKREIGTVRRDMKGHLKSKDIKIAIARSFLEGKENK